MKYLKRYKIFENNSKIFNNIELGELVGEGTTSFVFDIQNEPDKVIKIQYPLYNKEFDKSNYDIDDESELTNFGEEMKKFPTLFAKVYDNGLGWAVMEKLDVKKAEEEFKQMEIFYRNKYRRHRVFHNKPFDMNFDQEDNFPILRELAEQKVEKILKN